MNRRTEQSINLAGVMTLAAVVGATAALLLAPRKGSETRAQIKLKMDQARQKSAESVDSAKDKAHEIADKVKGKAETVSDDTKDAVAEARSQVEDVAAEVQARQRARRGGTSV